MAVHLHIILTAIAHEMPSLTVQWPWILLDLIDFCHSFVVRNIVLMYCMSDEHMPKEVKNLHTVCLIPYPFGDVLASLLTTLLRTRPSDLSPTILLTSQWV